MNIKNLSIKLKTSTLTSVYILLVLIISISFAAYNFKEKLFQEKISSLKENLTNLSESYKESVITSNLEKIDELVGFIKNIKAVKEVFVENEEGKIIGGTDFKYLGIKNPDLRKMSSKYSLFIHELKVENFTVGKVIVFYDEMPLKAEVITDIRKVITPLLFIVGFIIFASFIGTFFISSVLVLPLVKLKESITDLLHRGFVIDIPQEGEMDYIKKVGCIKNITDLCWIFSNDKSGKILDISDKVLKICVNCDIYKENTGDEIQQLANNFFIMVASLNSFIQKLEEAHKEREALSCMAAMGEMSARLAHEIKNALYSISNAASYIKQNTDDKTIKDFGRIIKDEANRLNEITVSFLNFSKLLEPKFEIKDINKTIIDAVELLKYDCEDEDITLSLVLDKDIKPIKHDPSLIKQVMFNLILNSIDAIKQKGINQIDCITIKTYKILNKDKTFLRIEVEDNGIGIKQDHVDKIFKPFFTTKQRGTGLGLSIVYKIVYAHGGNISVQTEFGKYAKFMIDLPYRGEEDESSFN